MSPSAICRGTAQDARLALSAVRGAAHGRIMVIVAASEATARALVHSDARTALDRGLDVVKDAVDRADGTAVDVCLVDAPRADHALVAEYAGRMTAQGAAAIVMCGPDPMLDALGKGLKERGVPRFEVFKEQFRPTRRDVEVPDDASLTSPSPSPVPDAPPPGRRATGPSWPSARPPG